MITFNKIRYDKDQGKTYCNICGELFKENTIVYISQQSFGMACEKCKKKFTDEQIEEFFYLFNKYGGHFKIYESNQIRLEEIVKEFFNFIKHKESSDLIEINQKIRHKALIHGFTPEQLVEKMKDLI